MSELDLAVHAAPLLFPCAVTAPAGAVILQRGLATLQLVLPDNVSDSQRLRLREPALQSVVIF